MGWDGVSMTLVVVREDQDLIEEGLVEQFSLTVEFCQSTRYVPRASAFLTSAGSIDVTLRPPVSL